MRSPRPSLWLSCLPLALSAAFSTQIAAQSEGFGGAPLEQESAEAPVPYDVRSQAGADEAAAEEISCLLQDDDGNWRACDQVLAARAQPAVQQGARANDTDERPPLAMPALPDDGKPKLREIAETRPAKGAFGRLVAGSGEQATEEFPLLRLRERVAALEVEAEELAQHATRNREAPAKQAEHRMWAAVLERVEGVAFHMMRSCIASDMPAWSETYTTPSLYRMTPGGPVLASREERRALPSFDPPGCERLRLVDDSTIEKARRLHEIEDTLRNGRLGYFERDQRKALEREATALEHDLGLGGLAPLPKLFDDEERKDTQAKPLKNRRRATGVPLLREQSGIQALDRERSTLTPRD